MKRIILTLLFFLVTLPAFAQGGKTDFTRYATALEQCDTAQDIESVSHHFC